MLDERRYEVIFMQNQNVSSRICKEDQVHDVCHH